MAELKVEAERCIEEEVVLDEKFRKRMAQSIKRNKVLLEKLAEL
jgi:hypothetical protein